MRWLRSTGDQSMDLKDVLAKLLQAVNIAVNDIAKIEVVMEQNEVELRKLSEEDLKTITDKIDGAEHMLVKVEELLQDKIDGGK